MNKFRDLFESISEFLSKFICGYFSAYLNNAVTQFASAAANFFTTMNNVDKSKLVYCL